MIKNVIFDIGNVLLDFCWKDHIARFGFQGEKADRHRPGDDACPIWPKLDLGLESDEDILEQFVAHTPELEQEIRLVFSDLSTIVREYEGSVDWIESLKARGYHTYYLSNYGERIRREASKELSFLSHMDGGIMSYTVHLAKPDPAIYQTLLDRYGLKAEECVFLDDTVRNVEAAQALGIAGIVVTSQEQAKKELETLL